jgi:hypothetical protein
MMMVSIRGPLSQRKEALERLHRNKVRPRLRKQNPKKAAMTIRLNLNLRRVTIRSHPL